MGLYRHVPSERAATASVDWKPSMPVIGREYEIPEPADNSQQVRARPHRYAAAYLTTFLMLAAIFAAYSGPIGDYRSGIAYSVHSPIYIDGDADLLARAASELWEGTGAEGSPIEIRDYQIDGSSNGYGIAILNTSLYVSIDLCYIYSGYLYGIHLVNVTNATVLGCKIESCGDGINFLQVSASIVADSNCSNSNNGLYQTRRVTSPSPT